MESIIHRFVDRNVDPHAFSSTSTAEALEIYRRMMRARWFENCIVEIVQNDTQHVFKVKVHMSSGQEGVAAALSIVARDGCQIFTQHRTMDVYIAYGAAPEGIRDEILCLSSGCAGGRIGGSFNYMTPQVQMYGHTGFIGENVSVGVGAALGNGKRTVCLFGDGAAEEDYVLEAMGFAATHKLPVLFVCTDNGLSVLSPMKKRRSWDITKVAEAFGIQAIDMADDPFSLMAYIRSLDPAAPAFINCYVNRNYWHAGTGVDGPPDWDRLAMVRKQLVATGLETEVVSIENEAEKEMRQVWEKYL